MGFGSLIQKVFRPVRLEKRVFDPEKIELEDLVLPDFIETFDETTIYSMVKEELVTYKSLQYNKKPFNDLEIKEYHSFQIGVMLRFFLLGYDLLIPDAKDIFPDFILKTPLDKVKYKVYYLINIYGNSVDRTLDGKQLVEDLRWSPIDAGFLLYYLSLYKK